jgi:hypothetical protein
MRLVQSARRADSRAAWTAGSNSATRTPMMAMTTNSSTSVKPRREFLGRPRDGGFSVTTEREGQVRSNDRGVYIGVFPRSTEC